LALVGVSNESEGKLEGYLDKHEVAFPIVSAPAASSKYGVKGYPTYYLVSAKGDVIAGPQHGKFSDKQIEEALKDVMLFPDVPNKGVFKSIKKLWKKRKFVEVSRELTKVLQDENASDADRAAAESIKEVLDTRIEGALETDKKAPDGPDYLATETRLKQIVKDFKGMPVEAEAKAILGEFKKDAKIKNEISASKKLASIRKKYKTSKKSDRKKLRAALASFVKKNGSTYAGGKADRLLESLAEER
jgi:hypothetical protein